MKVPTFFIAAMLAACVAIETWTLSEVVSLKVQLAELRRDLAHVTPNTAQKDRTQRMDPL